MYAVTNVYSHSEIASCSWLDCAEVKVSDEHSL